MGVNIKDIIKDFSLNVIVGGNQEVEITQNELNRSGLQLTGFYGYFVEKRIQLLGNAEMSYLRSLPEDLLHTAIENLMQHDIPCIIVTHNNPVPDILVHYGKKYNRWVLSTPSSTSNLHVELTSYLQDCLADSICFHGELLDVSGIGVLIKGHSGIGKSETALELIRKGHLLIADDNVIIKSPSPNVLVGTGTELTKDLMEIRGVGILDIKSIFGLRSVGSQKNIDLVVELVDWTKEMDYERIGDKYEYTKIMDVELPITYLPVLPGRNIAIIIEVIALNYRQNVLGYNAAQTLEEHFKKLHQNVDKP